MTSGGRAVLLKHMTEAEWLAQVVRWAKRGGWLVYHTRDSRGSTAGFPDLVLVKPPRVLFVELKRIGGRVSSVQHVWLDALEYVSVVYTRIWTPDDADNVKSILLGS